MKTLVVTLEYPPQVGGIASYIEQVLRYQTPSDVVVLAPVTPGSKENDAKWPWKTIRTNPSFPLVWPQWLPLYFTTKKVVASEQIEHVHVHHVLPVGYIAYHLKKKNKIKGYTVFLHGTDVVKAQASKRKAAWFKKICVSADKVVVNSAYLQQAVTILVPGVVVTVIHPCPADYFFEKVPAATIAQLKTQLAITGRKAFITVGRMVEGKGFPHIIRILPQVLAKVPDAVWLVVGNGPKRQALLDAIQKNGVQNAVRFLGDVSHDQLPALYQAADAFVMLTHPDAGGVAESWGTVFVEAAASGLPVVAGQSGGVAEAVQHGVTGLVVDANNDVEAVDAIVTVLTDQGKARAFGASGRARVTAEFNWGTQLTKL